MRGRTRDPAAPLELKRVTNVFQHVAHDLQAVSLQAQDGNVEVIHSTDEHPYFVEAKGWVGAVDLRVGDLVMKANGSAFTVIGNVDDKRPEGVLVYNFAVEGNHTYFVEDGVGENDWAWVHNAYSATSGENAYASIGRQMHNVHADLFAKAGFTVRTALPSGRIPDAFKLTRDAAGRVNGAIIRELKPNRTQSAARGISQLRSYGKEIARIHKLEPSQILLILDTYVR